jgi:hypothetical protein
MSNSGAPPPPAPPIQDPTGDRCPNFASATWVNMVSALMPAVAAGPDARPARSKDEVIASLRDQWQVDHDAEMAAWDLHLAAEKLIREAELEAEAAAAQAAEEKAREEKEAKRIKIARPVVGSRPSDKQVLRPSAWAISRLEAYKMHYLDYYTVKGMKRALAYRKTRDNTDLDVDGPKMGGGWQAVNTAGAADKEARPDKDLSWSEMTYAKSGWIGGMEKAGYESWVCDSWSLAFGTLDNLTAFRHDDVLEDRIIVNYIADIREEWYENIRTESPNFDPGVISYAKLKSIEARLVKEAQTSDLMECEYLDLPFRDTVLIYCALLPESPSLFRVFPPSMPCHAISPLAMPCNRPLYYERRFAQASGTIG